MEKLILLNCTVSNIKDSIISIENNTKLDSNTKQEYLKQLNDKLVNRPVMEYTSMRMALVDYLNNYNIDKDSIQIYTNTESLVHIMDKTKTCDELTEEHIQFLEHNNIYKF